MAVESGGIIFTTIQKFAPEEEEEQMPVLTDRRNVVVIADEAHRTQYGLEAKVRKKEDGAHVSFGFAKYLRDALPRLLLSGLLVPQWSWRTAIPLPSLATISIFMI